LSATQQPRNPELEIAAAASADVIRDEKRIRDVIVMPL
jgi:hypothetical protein